MWPRKLNFLTVWPVQKKYADPCLKPKKMDFSHHFTVSLRDRLLKKIFYCVITDT